MEIRDKTSQDQVFPMSNKVVKCALCEKTLFWMLFTNWWLFSSQEGLVLYTVYYGCG